MAWIPKKPAEGEATGGFVSITPNGDNYDPTQGPKNRDGFMGGRDPYKSSDKWDQFEPGMKDKGGARHDY